jgi:RNA polymerase sigma factor (sigma-70 family)
LEPDTSQQRKPENPESITDRPDGWLLREWKSGDERAAEVLLDRYAIRLVALVAGRLNRRYQSTVDPSEIVQSAMGSFFDAAKHSRIQVSTSVSMWRLLATFARRKMARSIERQTAIKRGGDQTRVPLESIESHAPISGETEQETDEFVVTLKAELPVELFEVIERLLAGQTQREIADALGIDERTVRRRVSRARELLDPEANTKRSVAQRATSPPTLPRVNYNQFVLGKLIGSGGFGKVYRASMQSDASTVAVKFLRKAFWQNEDARQSFVREISIASQIKHPGVIRYLGYGESPHGGPYVISEWIDGRSLQKVANATPNQIFGWLRQICDAIGAVHQAGLVHGDLTPSNVLVDENDVITITDFGFSQAFVGKTASKLGGPRVLGGTPGFAAPEQFDPAFGSIGPKTDVYAIGGLIHYLLLGKPPNGGNHFVDIVSETTKASKDDQSQFATCPQPFRAILAMTLRRSPADRSGSTDEIVDLLSRNV